jgi:hypothetical protein
MLVVDDNDKSDEEEWCMCEVITTRSSLNFFLAGLGHPLNPETRLIMSASKESILAAIANLLIFLSGANAYWYTLNTSHEHGFHLENRFGMTHERYVALLVAADLAKYVNGVLTSSYFSGKISYRGITFQTY